MMDGREPFLHLNRYSSLPEPGSRPVPPHSMILSAQNQWLRDCVGKFPGRKKQAALSDAPNIGIGVAPRWLTDTRPTRLFRGLVGGHSLRTAG